MDFAFHAAAGKNFRALLGFDVADDLTGNLNLTDGYVGPHDGALSNHEPVVAKDGSGKISINAKHATKVQFSAQLYSFVQKSRNLVRSFALDFHRSCEFTSKLWHGDIQIQSIKLMDFGAARAMFRGALHVLSRT